MRLLDVGFFFSHIKKHACQLVGAIVIWTEEKKRSNLENEHVIKKTSFCVSCAIFSLEK